VTYGSVMRWQRWRILPAMAATLLAVAIVYGIYHGLTATQVVGVASGTPGGGFYELGEKLLQVLNTDLGEQRLEAPVVFQKVDSRGPRQNLQHLADRKAQLGIAVEGLTVKPKVTGSADIRGLVKLSDSILHVVVSPQVSRTARRRIVQFTDLLTDHRTKLGHPLRVFMGSEHSATHTVMGLLLNYYKLSPETGLPWEIMEQGSYMDAANAFIEGKIDVVCLFVPIGSPAVMTMATHGVLLPLTDAASDAIHTLRPSLFSAMIPSGVYNKDFPSAGLRSLGADDILVANGEISNRLAFRIVRTIAVHWQELQSGMLLAADFAQAQLNENDYYPLHPGAVTYYKGENVPLWPWFEDKIRLIIDHREVVLSVVGGIPTLYALVYAWYQRRRVNQLMGQITALKTHGAIDRATIENIRMHALTLVAQGKLSRDSYGSLNDYIEAQLHQVPLEPPAGNPPSMPPA
jgi:uncharacterized protein